MSDLKYYNAFNQIPQIGPVRFGRLLNFFPNLEEAWKAPVSELVRAGLELKIAEITQTKRPQINPDSEMEKLERAGVKVITQQQEEYPRLLKEIYNPPALLYIRGDPKILSHEYAIAVVGTRKISPYGKQVTPVIVHELASAGITVVSGLAYGVDELVHRACLEAAGKTVAVLGCGIDDLSIYPASNRVLAKKIIDSGGAIISELPLGALPLKMHFPHRNRIIAGLALGTLVVEADLESGALITAKAALEFNRQVFAVPGPILNQTSAGPNNLLKLGARAVTSANDILEELNLTLVTSQLSARKIIADSPLEEKLLNLLSYEPAHIDQLTKKSGLSAAEVASTLTMMEIKGKVKNLGAMQYVRAR